MDDLNLWPEFSEDPSQSAKEILEKQAELLPGRTNNLLYAEISELNMNLEFHYDKYDLGYKFLIRSKLLDKYSYEMFSFYHNITLYPLQIKLDIDIRRELGIEGSIYMQNENEFKEFLRKVFATEKVNSVIGSLMKLSKQ